MPYLSGPRLIFFSSWVLRSRNSRPHGPPPYGGGQTREGRKPVPPGAGDALGIGVRHPHGSDSTSEPTPPKGGSDDPLYIYIYKGIVRSYEKRQKYINCYYVFIRVDGLRECSSVGRASHLHCEGRGFETCHFHNY